MLTGHNRSMEGMEMVHKCMAAAADHGLMLDLLQCSTEAARLEQARKLGPDVIEMRAIKHTMELIAHSLCIANGAPAKVAREGRPGKMALLNG